MSPALAVPAPSRASLRAAAGAIVLFLAASPASALECQAPADWVERTLCDSQELTSLDTQVSRHETQLAETVDARFRAGIEQTASAWRASRPGCRKERYPLACLEGLHYARLQTLGYLANLFIGPRRFGDPLRGCWSRAENEDHVQTCLDVRQGNARTGLAIAAQGVRAALEKRDAADGAAGDATRLFEAAETAFAAHAEASCESESAALGEGRGRQLGGTACRITAIRTRSVDILRFVPGLAPLWATRLRRAQDAIKACIAKSGPLPVLHVDGDDETTRIRLQKSRKKKIAEREDCVVGTADNAVRSVDPVPETDARPDEEIVQFLPGEAPPPPLDCGLAEPVLDRSGRVLGHLVVAAC